MKDSGLILIALGFLLLLWPQVQRLILPNFRSSIPWERIIWGHRPGIIPRFIGIVCLLIGGILAPNGLELKQSLWLAGLVSLILVVSTLVSAQLSNQQRMHQTEAAYFQGLSKTKRILYSVAIFTSWLIAVLIWWFVGKSGTVLIFDWNN